MTLRATRNNGDRSIGSSQNDRSKTSRLSKTAWPVIPTVQGGPCEKSGRFLPRHFVDHVQLCEYGSNSSMELHGSDGTEGGHTGKPLEAVHAPTAARRC